MFASLHTAPFVPARLSAIDRIESAIRTLRTAIQERRQAAFIARLDDRTLSDFGLFRDHSIANATRPMWDLPGNPTNRMPQ